MSTIVRTLDETNLVDAVTFQSFSKNVVPCLSLRTAGRTHTVHLAFAYKPFRE